MAPYPAAVLLALFSFIIIVLITPPLWWHIKNKNVGAASIIAWIILVNLISFINAIIWPNDDFQQNPYRGQGLCDIEVKIEVASQVAFPAAFACILRALAKIMDTKRPMLGRTSSQKKIDLAIDLSWCFGFPALQMIFHYIIQARRYYIFAISGCDPAVSPTWATIWLIHIPPVIWTLVCAIYSVLILVRLYLHRRSIKNILDSNNYNKSRFLRLFLLCTLWIFANVPIQFYVFSLAFKLPRETFYWSDVHNPVTFNQILTIPTAGILLYDRYIWLSAGIAIFVFFGFGTEAVTMYKSTFKALHLHRLVPERVKKSSSNASAGSQVQLWNRNAKKPSQYSMTTDSFSDDIELGRKHTQSI